MVQDKLKLLLSQVGENRLQIEVDIRSHLLSEKAEKVAGFYIATNQNELVEIINLSEELKIPYLLIGSGSKSTIAKDFQGLVIKNRSDNIRIFGIKGQVTQQGLRLSSANIETDSGVSMEKLLEFVDKQWLSGLEMLENIPGTLGGNFLTNSQIQDKADHVKVLNNKCEVLDKSPQEIKRDDTIISVTFKLKAKDAK